MLGRSRPGGEGNGKIACDRNHLWPGSDGATMAELLHSQLLEVGGRTYRVYSAGAGRADQRYQEEEEDQWSAARPAQHFDEEEDEEMGEVRLPPLTRGATPHNGCLGRSLHWVAGNAPAARQRRRVTRASCRRAASLCAASSWTQRRVGRSGCGQAVVPVAAVKCK